MANLLNHTLKTGEPLRKSFLLVTAVFVAGLLAVSCGDDLGGVDGEGNFTDLKDKNVVFNSNGATKTASPTSLNYEGTTVKLTDAIYQYIKEVHTTETDPMTGEPIEVNGIVGATPEEIANWQGPAVPEDGFALNPEWEKPGTDLLGWQAKRGNSATKDYPEPTVTKEDLLADADTLNDTDLDFTHTKFNGATEIFWVIDQLPQAPAKLNSKFNGWNISKDGTGPKVDVGTKLTKQKMTVYAQWVTDEKNQLQFTGGEISYKILDPGFYQVELWGGQGWNPDSDTESQYGGRGAYTRGIYYVSEADAAEDSGWNYFYIRIAGRGVGGKTSYNGAGYNYTGDAAKHTDEGAGGGASDIRWGGSSIYDRIQVSGGGGGANDAAKTGHGGAVGVNFQKGGWGGVLEGAHSNYKETQDDPGIGASQTPGGRGTQPPTTTNEQDWQILINPDNQGRWASRPINQTGQPNPVNTAERIYQGRFYQGGYYLGVSESAGAGGGGWYGGHAGGQSWHNGGGGGGSSFIVGIKGFIGISAKGTQWNDTNGYTAPTPRSGDSSVDGTAADFIEIAMVEKIRGNEIMTGADGEQVGTGDYETTEIPHTIKVYRGTDEKATLYQQGNNKVAIGNADNNKNHSNDAKKILNRRAIPKLVLFAGEPNLEKEYTTTAIAGNKSMPSPDGGTEVGHIGAGFGRITYLGDGITHEIVELEEPDVDEETDETGEVIE